MEDDSTLNEDHGEDQKDTALPSTTSVSLADTSVGLNYIAWQTSTPGTMQSLTAPAAADIFDDIGYSDEDEGEPSTISAPAVPTSNLTDPMTIKPPSPKRSIDEVDDLTSEYHRHNSSLRR